MSVTFVDFIDGNQARRMGVLKSIEPDSCIVEVLGKKHNVPNDKILNKIERKGGTDGTNQKSTNNH